jgi:hypothetical protein
MRRLALIVLCFVFPVLSLSVGCGGGEDPTPDAGPLPPPPPPDAGPPDAGPPDAGPSDLVPPAVVSNFPANNAIAVPPESVVEVTFNEEMQVSRGFLNFQPATGIPNNGTLTVRPENWDGARRKVTLTFPQGLPVRARLTVTASNFADVAGNPLPAPYTFSFTVSDGQPPRVIEAAPFEGAASVPLTTAQVSFTFNEPMDTSVGNFVPGGGLMLGPVTWTGNTKASAPITGGLVYNGLYSVRLNNFRNANLKAFDGTPYLGDGKLDFGTGPDTTKPTVSEASPPEGATGVLPENASFIVLTFSEPMDRTMGRAELFDTGGNTVLTPNWAPDNFSVTYDVRLRLRYSSATRVVLTGFRDRAGNALDPAPYLGDGELDFQTGVDTVKPFLESSTPQEGAQDVYPAEVFVTGSTPPTSLRKIVTLRFNEPMDQTLRRVVLRETYNASAFRNLDGLWSTDGLTLTVTIPSPGSGQTPLVEEYSYSLDLTALKDRNGNALDALHPSLGDGKLDFYTLRNSPGLNHACEHALLLSPITVNATAAAGAAPRADTIHSRYGVNLLSNGTSFSGFVRMDLTPETNFTLYLDRDATVTVFDAATNAERQLTRTAVPPACAQLTHLVSFATPQGPTVNVRFGPMPDPTLRFIPELYFFQ